MPAGVTAGSRSTQSVIGHRKCRGAFSSSSHSGRRTGSGQCDAELPLPEELDGVRAGLGLVTIASSNRGALGRRLGVESSSSSSRLTLTNAPPNPNLLSCLGLSAAIAALRSESANG